MTKAVGLTTTVLITNVRAIGDEVLSRKEGALQTLQKRMHWAQGSCWCLERRERKI